MTIRGYTINVSKQTNQGRHAYQFRTAPDTNAVQVCENVIRLRLAFPEPLYKIEVDFWEHYGQEVCIDELIENNLDAQNRTDA